MRPAVNKTENKKPQSLTASWRRKGVAALASLGVLTGAAPAATAANDANRTVSLSDSAVSHYNKAGGDMQTIIRVRAENCVNIDAAGLAQSQATSIKPVFDSMARQPITGAALIARLANPASSFQVCLDASLPSITSGVIAAYQGDQRRLFVPKMGAGIDSIAHEAFHAYQHVQGGLVSSSTPLNERDMAMGILIAEASAAAYTYMVIRESAFEDPAAWTSYLAAGGDYNMNENFTTAFDASYASNASMDETARRRAALQAGGTAVVDALLSNATPGWSRPYAMNARGATRLADDNADPSTRRYHEIRDEVFRRAARVSDSVNILPARFTGAGADATIADSLEKIGLELRAVPAPDFNPRRRP